MPDLDPVAEFLQNELLKDFIADGGAVRVPPPAPGAGAGAPKVMALASGLTLKVWGGARPSASIMFRTGTVNFTIGWFCERWCSTYLLLKSMVIVPSLDEQLITILPRESEFSWPAIVPPPSTQGDALVSHANKVFPWVVLPTVLHEVGHAVEAESLLPREKLELRCDEIAALHLVGKRQDEFRDISMLGAAIWLCCLCSEDRVREKIVGNEYPSPVDRVRAYLIGFVPRETELGSRIWLLCVSHVMRLTVQRNRSALDAVLERKHADLDALLDDLRGCWP